MTPFFLDCSDVNYIIKCMEIAQRLFDAVDRVWVCVKPGSRSFHKPLRQDKYMASGVPRARATTRDEWAGNRIIIDGETKSWIKLPAVMFIGLCNTYCINPDHCLMLLDAGGSRRDRYRFYNRNLKLFKEINEHCHEVSGKDSDYEGAKVWRRKMQLVITRFLNSAPEEYVNTDILYLNT